MHRYKVLPPVILAAMFGINSIASAREQTQVVTPASSIEKPGDEGVRVHTNFKLLVQAGVKGGASGGISPLVLSNPMPNAVGLPPYSGWPYQTPASFACHYGLVAPGVANCNPNQVTAVPSGGSKAIAIVDAYHYPNAAADLAAFSAQFGLPVANLTVVYASGTQPATSPNGWEVEEALDLQWAHAMAPNAKLFLVEAASSSNADLLKAVDVAATRVRNNGGGEVSMSWGGSESSSELTWDTHFQPSATSTVPVVYVASSGDSGTQSWPCVSPNVVCVGGTTLRTGITGGFLQEVAWVESGGGASKYFPIPSYQQTHVTGNYRAAPDVALAGDPNSGGWIYYTASDGSFSGWTVIGGTSWSAPAFAGILNSAGTFRQTSNAQLTNIYSNSALFTDVKIGWCGYFDTDVSVTGWDKCTGVGRPVGTSGL